jgi:hypothetical protein
MEILRAETGRLAQGAAEPLAGLLQVVRQGGDFLPQSVKLFRGGIGCIGQLAGSPVRPAHSGAGGSANPLRCFGKSSSPGHGNLLPSWISAIIHLLFPQGQFIAIVIAQ